MTTPTDRSTGPQAAPTLLLHIGSGKTGTTTLQGFLAGRRADLASTGVLYPRAPGRRRHVRLSLFAKPDDVMVREPAWRNQRFAGPGRFRTVFRERLAREVREAGLPTLLMSDEALYGMAVADMPRLRDLLGAVARDLRAVVYLRRQDEHLLSRYQQLVKMGQTQRLAETVRDDKSSTYDYRARLEAWRTHMAPEALLVRRFDRESLVGGSVLPDFVEATGLGIDVGRDDVAVRRNETLDADAVELLRLVNLHKQEDLGQQPHEIGNRPLVNALTRLAQGPRLSLPEADLDAFMARWEDSNAAVARDLLGLADGRLFLPRRTAEVTTRQVLDPDRLEDYLSLPEIPEEMHDPLRRLVRREAGTADDPG